MYLTHQAWPIFHNRAIWEARLYVAQRTISQHTRAREYSRELLRDACLEDGSTLEASHEDLESGAISHCVPQNQELYVRHFAKVLEDHVDA
jgi:hypothetical protein